MRFRILGSGTRFVALLADISGIVQKGRREGFRRALGPDRSQTSSQPSRSRDVAANTARLMDIVMIAHRAGKIAG